MNRGYLAKFLNFVSTTITNLISCWSALTLQVKCEVKHTTSQNEVSKKRVNFSFIIADSKEISSRLRHKKYLKTKFYRKEFIQYIFSRLFNVVLLYMFYTMKYMCVVWKLFWYTLYKVIEIFYTIFFFAFLHTFYNNQVNCMTGKKNSFYLYIYFCVLSLCRPLHFFPSSSPFMAKLNSKLRNAERLVVVLFLSLQEKVTSSMGGGDSDDASYKKLIV